MSHKAHGEDGCPHYEPNFRQDYHREIRCTFLLPNFSPSRNYCDGNLSIRTVIDAVKQEQTQLRCLQGYRFIVCICHGAHERAD